MPTLRFRLAAPACVVAVGLATSPSFASALLRAKYGTLIKALQRRA